MQLLSNKADLEVISLFCIYSISWLIANLIYKAIVFHSLCLVGLFNHDF